MADGVAGGPGSRPADQLRGRLRHSAVNDGGGPDRLRRRITLHRSADGAGVSVAAAVAVLPGMPGRDRGTLATLVATAVGLRLPNPSVPAGRHLPVLRSLAADRSPPPRPRADTESVFPQSGQRLRARSATVRRRPVGRAGRSTLPPRQRSSEVQSTILGAYRNGCAAFGIYAPDPVSATQLTADLSGLAARILRYAHTEDLVGLLPTDLLDTYRQCVTNRPAHQPHAATPVSGAAETAVAAVVAMRVTHLFRSPRRRSATALVGFGVAAARSGGHRLQHRVEPPHQRRFAQCPIMFAVTVFNAQRPTAVPQRRGPPHCP